MNWINVTRHSFYFMYKRWAVLASYFWLSLVFLSSSIFEWLISQDFIEFLLVSGHIYFELGRIGLFNAGQSQRISYNIFTCWMMSRANRVALPIDLATLHRPFSGFAWRLPVTFQRSAQCKQSARFGCNFCGFLLVSRGEVSTLVASPASIASSPHLKIVSRLLNYIRFYFTPSLITFQRVANL